MHRGHAWTRSQQVVEPREDGASNAAVDEAIADSSQGVGEAVSAVKARIDGTEKGKKCRPI